MIPIPLIKEFLREENLSDEIIALLLKGAISLVRTYLGYSFERGSYTDTGEGETIYLSYAPIVEIASITVDDEEVTEYSTIDRLGIVVIEGNVDTVTVQYTAGYDTLPTDLQLGILICCQAVYQRFGSFGAKKESVQGYSVEFVDDIPEAAKRILQPYWRPPKC